MNSVCVSERGERKCECELPQHPPKFVVLTGGPGAGKTAVLELIKKSFCTHIQILPESASILFSGGFIRGKDEISRRGAQRAIYYVQRELEQIALEKKLSAVVLCDRGTLDGLAYWIGDEKSFYDSFQTSREKEFSRYEAVIHLRSPNAETGYNHENPMRIETPEEAAIIDDKIAKIWAFHPHYQPIESAQDFMQKALKAISAIKLYIPTCCHQHALK